MIEGVAPITDGSGAPQAMGFPFACYPVCNAPRTDCSPARMTLGVARRLEEVGPMPIIVEFFLSDKRRLRYLGHQSA